MKFARRRPRLDPSQLRLPLIALIDVVLFLLMYFMLAGTLEISEAQLAAALRTENNGGAGSDLQPQVIDVDVVDGQTIFKIGSQTFTDRRDLEKLLRGLPKDIGVVVRATDRSSVAAVAAATQSGRDAGFTKVSYTPVH